MTGYWGSPNRGSLPDQDRAVVCFDYATGQSGNNSPVFTMVAWSGKSDQQSLATFV
jgi:hypothetical protein